MAIFIYNSFKTSLVFLFKRKDILLPVFLIALFLIEIVVNAPLKQVFEYFVDEGFTLMGGFPSPERFPSL
ncbi:MAG: hypothetical protein AMJ95_02330 [Omnitrophica WOR_2 bacterium SM23_72]|nr:MAG: hypothetical protein AMJ95_02330 [Omnitrophica WOR_2 bacterium SM23_72]